MCYHGTRPYGGRDSRGPMTENDPDDDISEIVVSGSEYEQLRLVSGVFTSRSLQWKVRLHAALLFALATIYPIALVLPAGVRPFFPGSTPALGSPNILVVGVGGALAQTFGGVLTWFVAYRADSRDGDEIDARRYVALESVASVFGYGTGGIAILLTVGFFLVNLGGVGAAEALREALASARGTYEPSVVGVSVRTLGTVSFLVGLVLVVGSRLSGGRDG